VAPAAAIVHAFTLWRNAFRDAWRDHRTGLTPLGALSGISSVSEGRTGSRPQPHQGAQLGFGEHAMSVFGGAENPRDEPTGLRQALLAQPVAGVGRA